MSKRGVVWKTSGSQTVGEELRRVRVAEWVSENERVRASKSLLSRRGVASSSQTISLVEEEAPNDCAYEDLQQFTGLNWVLVEEGGASKLQGPWGELERGKRVLEAVKVFQGRGFIIN
jgi:hypothetical protein